MHAAKVTEYNTGHVCFDVQASLCSRRELLLRQAPSYLLLNMQVEHPRSCTGCYYVTWKVMHLPCRGTTRPSAHCGHMPNFNTA